MKTEKTYTTLPFNKIRKYGGKYVFTQTNTIDNEVYEEISDPDFMPSNLIEFYLKTMIDKPETETPIDIPAGMLISTIENVIIDKIEEKSKSLYFSESNVNESIRSVLTEVKASSDVFTISEETETNLYFYMNATLTDQDQNGNKAFRSMVNDAGMIIKNLKSYTSKTLKILSGGPGCGKTYRCIKDIEANGYTKVLVTSLSNIVGLRFLARMNLKGSEQWSFTKVAFSRMNAIQDFDAIVVEEASMISSREFGAILKLINTGKPLYFLGDPDQLPGFTGLGNLFSTLLREFPSYVQMLTKQRRMNEDLIKVANTVKTYGVLPERTDKYNPYETFFNWVKSGEDAMAITYKNEDCVFLNDITINKCFGIEASYSLTKSKKDVDQESWRNVIMEAAAKHIPLKVVSKSNLSIRGTDAATGKPKFVRIVSNGEQGVLTLTSEGFEFTSKENGNSRIFSMQDILFHFRLGYALTIHKAQGSEWNYVFYLEPKIYPAMRYSLNLRYVAVTRAKTTLIWKDENRSRVRLKFLDFNHIISNN